MGGCNKMCTITRLEVIINYHFLSFFLFFFQVINVFRRLHRVCQRVFKGDEEALKGVVSISQKIELKLYVTYNF